MVPESWLAFDREEMGEPAPADTRPVSNDCSVPRINISIQIIVDQRSNARDGDEGNRRLAG